MTQRLNGLRVGLALCLLALPAWAGGEDPAAVLTGTNIGETTVSARAVDLRSGEVVMDVNGSRTLIPASNMKLVTSAAALDVLGQDFRFRTELRLHKAGNQTQLVVVGDGDPAFGDRKLLRRHDLDLEPLLTKWVEAVKAQRV
ncbi:MAG: D-alanyl-D-alanine carboxypeptidase, partial [Phycisphaeraceae bacterium]|nr:D-alanyl-D-alanine carboxypeptidase [Phycisphaeraceae bacterium]